MKLNKNELKIIKGGAGISGSLVSALVKGINSFMDIGRYLGSGLRRLFGGKICPIN